MTRRIDFVDYQNVIVHKSTVKQSTEHDSRLKRGYTDFRILHNRQSGHIAIAMHMKNALGKFLCIIYPDGTVDGGKMNEVKIRSDF